MLRPTAASTEIAPGNGFPTSLKFMWTVLSPDCMGRDTKGIYKRAREGAISTVPGLQAVYEPPEQPDLVVPGNRVDPESAAERVLAKLIEKRYL